MELKTSKQIYNNYIIGHTKSKAITKKIGPKDLKTIKFEIHVVRYTHRYLIEGDKASATKYGKCFMSVIGTYSISNCRV